MLLPFFLSLTDLYFLIPSVITQTFTPLAELVIPIEIPTNEAKAGMETHAVITEIIIRECPR